MPGAERVVMLAGRLLREGVLQQSALSANDASCVPAKGAALLDAVLAVVDRCEALVDAGRAGRDASRRSTSGRCCAPARRPAPTTSRASATGSATTLARLEALTMSDAGPAATVEYTDVRELRGPLLVVQGVPASAGTSSPRSGWTSGEIRHGLVLEVDRDLAVVQVLEGTDGMRPARQPGRVRRGAAAHPGRRRLAGPGLQRPRRARRRRPAGARPDRRAPVAGHPINPIAP